MGRSEAFARHFSAGWPAPRVDTMASNKLARRSVFSVIFIFAALVVAFPQDIPKREFISYDAARPVVAAFVDSLPAELKPASSLDAAKWSAWVQKADREVRDRLNKGEEDTLTNLLRFGVTFTKEYRIDDDYLKRYGSSSLVDSFAENRANDLIRALSKPDSWTQNSSEGMERMRAFLTKKGFSLKTPEQRKRVKRYLLDNLARMRDDVQRYRAPANEATRAQLFKDRGISLDTNLWPDFLLDQHFRRMVEKGMLNPGSVTKIAIVGPGLDFANKEKGNDFYPPQTIQPFAVVDSLVRLGVAKGDTVELYTLDISSEVNYHVAGARKNAIAGHAYTIQLPWNTAARHTPEYRKNFVEYWQRLGDQIGEPVEPIEAPDSVQGAVTDMQTRAVKIRPGIVRRIQPLDMNIVYQRKPLSAQQGFDLVIGTNIFIYYDAFEQSLARANIATMLKPGGFLLSNDKFPDTVPSGLTNALDTTLLVARDPDRTDTMYCYRKEK
jgi:hypothetical protein